MNSKAILLATVVFSAAISASAMADSFYYRAKGSPTSNIPADPNNDSEETPPESSPTATIGFVADKYRAGTTISGTLDTSLAAPTWSFEQNPAEPAIAFTVVEGGLTATAPAVEEETTFQVSASAAEGNQSGNADPVSVTVYPLLSISGGPTGEIKGATGTALDPQPAYVLKGLVDTASYGLLWADAIVLTCGKFRNSMPRSLLLDDGRSDLGEADGCMFACEPNRQGQGFIRRSRGDERNIFNFCHP